MKTLQESIIGRKGVSSGKTGLWQIGMLVPVSSNKKGKIYDILTHITEQNNRRARRANYDSYIDQLSDLLKIKSNIAGFRNKAEAIEVAQKYAKQINPSEYRFIGITRSYDDEPGSLDWDYILGIDNNRKLFIMHKN